MKTLIWKELREHIRWIPFGLLPMLYLIYQSVSLAAPVLDAERQLASMVAMVASIFACLLGALQSWPDNRPAARALLLHRGVTVKSAFSAKLVVALIVFTAAILLPLLGLAAWIAIDARRTIAGYAIEVLPSAFAAIISFVAWPTVFLVVHRKAGFFGSRLFPVGTAGSVVFTSASMLDSPSGAALVFSAVSLTLASLLMLFAARSVFISNAEPKEFPRAANWAINSWCLLVGFVFAMGTVLTAFQPEPDPQRYLSRSVILGPDGDAWLRSSSSWGDASELFAKMSPDESVRRKLQPVAKDWQSPPSWNTGGQQRGPSLGFSLIRADQLGLGLQRVWLFDHIASEVLVYHVESRYRTKSALRAKLSTGKSGFGRLASGYWTYGIETDQGGNATALKKPGALLPTANGLSFLSPDGQSTQQVYETPAGHHVISAQFGKRMAEGIMDMALRLDDRVVLIWSGDVAMQKEHVIDLGEVGDYGSVHALEILLPTEIKETDSARIALHPHNVGEYVAVTSEFDQITWDQSQRWYRFDSAGKIIEEVAYHEILYSRVVLGDRALAAVIPPGILGIVACAESLVSDPSTLLPGIINTIRNEPLEALSFALILTVQSIISVVLAIWAVRRRNVSLRIRKRWYIAAILFGPMAALGILTVYPKIAMERCASCHALTPVTSSKCQHCHESLDETTHTGIEVFDHDKVSVDSRMATAV